MKSFINFTTKPDGSMKFFNVLWTNEISPALGSIRARLQDKIWPKVNSHLELENAYLDIQRLWNQNDSGTQHWDQHMVGLNLNEDLRSTVKLAQVFSYQNFHFQKQLQAACVVLVLKISDLSFSWSFNRSWPDVLSWLSANSTSTLLLEPVRIS